MNKSGNVIKKILGAACVVAAIFAVSTTAVFVSDAHALTSGVKPRK